MPLRPTIISAPFGNYVQPDGATATLGTFTAAARPGRVRQVLKTVRYSPTLHAWRNKIGLRNPGIDRLAQRVHADRLDVSDKLVSIHGFNARDWDVLLNRIAEIRPMGVELNMSCPNVGEIDWPQTLFADARATGVPIVVKLPPIHYELLAQQAIDAGIRTFHATNTLPLPGGRGGLSGAPLKPIALACLGHLGRVHADLEPPLVLIGGGGIRAPSDIDDYVAAGAAHVALGTITMNPLLLLTHRPLHPLIRAAADSLNSPQPSR